MNDSYLLKCANFLSGKISNCWKYESMPSTPNSSLDAGGSSVLVQRAIGRDSVSWSLLGNHCYMIIP